MALLDKHKTTKPPQYPLSAYEGDYLCRVGKSVLSVTAHNYGLFIRVNGSQHTTYDLLPYDGDTFYRPADHDEVCTRSRFPSLWPDVHKFTFVTNSDGAVDRLMWGHDPAVKAQVF